MENKIQLPTTSMKMKSDDGVNDLPVQVGTLWNIEDTYVSRTPFCIKNISDENITLSVRLYGMTESIETVFFILGGILNWLLRLRALRAGLFKVDGYDKFSWELDNSSPEE